MTKRIVAIVFIYLCTALAWIILGATVQLRTHELDGKLYSAVGQLWGIMQTQESPELYYQLYQEVKVETTKGAETIVETKKEYSSYYVPLEASDINVSLKIDYRRKGLLWYSVYTVMYQGVYQLKNPTDVERLFTFHFRFPTDQAIYDNFHFVVGEQEKINIQTTGGQLFENVKLQPDQVQTIKVSYTSQGMQEWRYTFGREVNQVKNFKLTMNTDFNRIDFPSGTVSPTTKQETADGWNLTWNYSSLLANLKIGMILPQRLNPGPWVSKVSYSAPISLFLFFFLLFVFTTLRKINVHPMNYFFVGAAFFSFHLLLAYLVDHVSIHLAFIIASVVSIFLVISYMRLVTGGRFAVVEVGLSQFVYLVIFSYTYFFEGYTGLAVTILCIITLFIVMQFTGRLDWSEVFEKDPKKKNLAA